MESNVKGKAMKWLNHLMTVVLAAVFIGVMFMLVMSIISDKEPSVFGYQFKIVLSGSMEPAIQTGSMIVVEPVSDPSVFKKDDIITFQEENNRLVTHRVMDTIHNGKTTLYRTKGDSNDGPDVNPVLPENIVASYTGITIPYLGYIVSFFQSPNGALFIMFSGFLLLCYSFYNIWWAISKVDVVLKGD